MSAKRASVPTGGSGLLRGSRTKSYGSLVRSPLSPVRQGRIEHDVQPGETLQGLALKYGVSMEQIKRANRLYTNDSIFLKKSLSIPVLTDPGAFNNGVESSEEGASQSRGSEHGGDQSHNSDQVNRTDEGHASGVEETSEMSPMDFLKRIDSLIHQSKQAAAKKIKEGEKGFAGVEQAYQCRASSSQVTESRNSTSSPKMHQRAMLGAVPLTITKHTKKLKDREDEIFEL
ncbi:lysM and putative peptidoglycan-binding domain-containing protein 1 [Megalops cyprinoides]|uniref:lysM and putative peptidoglycan-binding domain-containing protein 1 n=1 Tax=Megalops cyprinoides TaxID=118141 RepID=UPI001864D4E3|nr:lysM and putative peptidoglycan-binding domain-containing protein 1 [Megalops cyprinoides]